LIQKSGARIIIIACTIYDTANPFAVAEQMGMTKPPYMWIGMHANIRMSCFLPSVLCSSDVLCYVCSLLCFPCRRHGNKRNFHNFPHFPRFQCSSLCFPLAVQVYVNISNPKFVDVRTRLYQMPVWNTRPLSSFGKLTSCMYDGKNQRCL
jgi:hypothetical protein